MRWSKNVLILVFILAAVTSSFHASALTINATATATFNSSQHWNYRTETRYLASTSPIVGQATVRSVIATEDGQSWEDVNSAVLVGLSTDPQAVSCAIGMVLQQDQEAFFPQWRLSLSSSTGLLLDKPRDLLSISPVNGHRYEAILSYDRKTGSVSYRLTDLTAAQTIAAGGLLIRQYEGPLFGMLNYRSNPAKHNLLYANGDVYPMFLPVGNTWGITSSKGNNGTPGLYVNQVSRSEKAYVNLYVPIGNGATNGEYQVLYDSIAGTKKLLPISLMAGNNYTELPNNEFGFGSSVVSLQYVVNGQVVLNDQTHLSFDELRLDIGSIQKTELGLVGQATLRSESLIPFDPKLTINATVYKLIWDPTYRSYKSYFYKDISVYSGTLKPELGLGFTIPVPAEAGYWRVVFHSEVNWPNQLPPPLRVSGADQTFTTYLPAEVRPNEPYSMVVLGDTQLTTWHKADRSHILDRQMLWIAENAQAKNIALVLQVGDITEFNHPVEWEHAVNSFGYLDSIVPYAVAEGNHDILQDTYEKSARKASRINQYFQVSQFPTLGGVFEAGRIENSYYQLDVGDTKYLVVSLEYAPRDEVLVWTNEVIAAHSDRKVILVTHHFLTNTGLPVAPGVTNDLAGLSLVARNPGETTNDGKDIWQKVGRLHANMFLIVSGHMPAPSIPYHIDKGLAGNFVYEILVDYQAEPNGGNGWLALLNFSTDNTIEVQAYSPYLSQYKKDQDQLGFGNHFMIDLRTNTIIKR